MNYSPYSIEWHRKRCLKEAIDTYLNDYVDNDVILNDILDILSERSEYAFREFKRTLDLEKKIYSNKY
jgi:hypothetical protein